MFLINKNQRLGCGFVAVLLCLNGDCVAAVLDHDGELFATSKEGDNERVFIGELLAVAAPMHVSKEGGELVRFTRCGC